MQLQIRNTSLGLGNVRADGLAGNVQITPVA